MPASIGYSVPDITTLKNINGSILTTGYSRLVISNRAWYIYISTANDTADDNNIVQPIGNPGRWFKTNALVVANTILDLNEFIDDRINALLNNSSTIEKIYNDTANSLQLTIRSNSIGDNEVDSISISSVSDLQNQLNSKASASHNHTTAQISDFAESVDDRVSALLQSGTGITLNYNDTTNTLVISGTPVPTEYFDEGVSQGSATEFNVTGELASLNVSGNTATLNITTPDTSIEIREEGVPVGSVRTINFTGSGVSSVTISNDIATVDITGGGAGTSAINQVNYTVTTSNLAVNGNQTVTESGELGLILRRVSSNFPCRVRIYIDSLSASNDLGRPAETELQGEHGCLFECVLTPTNLELDLSPPVILYKKSPTDNLHITVNNIDNTNRTYNIILNTLRW